MQPITTYYDRLNNESDFHKMLSSKFIDLWDKYPSLDDNEMMIMDAELLETLREIFLAESCSGLMSGVETQIIGGIFELANCDHIPCSFSYFMGKFNCSYSIDLYINSRNNRYAIKKYIIEHDSVDTFIAQMDREIAANIYNHTRSRMPIMPQNSIDRSEFISEMKAREVEFMRNHPRDLRCEHFYTMDDLYDEMPDGYEIGVMI